MPNRTLDGLIVGMCDNDQDWRAVFAARGDPEWSRDPIFASMRSRTENIGAVLARLATVMEQRTTDEWLELMRKAEIPATPIASPSDLLHDPQLEIGRASCRERVGQ